MPYDNLKDLPKSVRHVLPKHAQEIYLAAFNRAWVRNPHDVWGRRNADNTACPWGMFLLGLMADLACRYTSLPQVTVFKVSGL
jgi:hypothetical protein